ncbi:MAG: Threonine-tRNA ligase [Parcubacteria group bacterium GW2011_GWB1_45_7]|uniref:Threonine--tRNA ligase n=3 Tax=Parcubacteria group TaxID=1794811 RepID=A0A0H4T6R5_9BACT|nr:threonyl-tRNA synthetase, threonyl-tRNA synthetase [uncultured Parcubacteria bacterium Rifle_16ft_4_minimus_37647]KKU11638.1 MAG: Threonine-tRNA ligase [Parcubacteria group bacterium GW2011_GWB1_45_7]OGY58758.1 MAG: threonine--tRNA ligase [Candidatus Colwellbacteria bacterium RIFCSPHIGHO2_02_FULL_45_17]OGY60482.1 MAG: threonine--tRNA ligase [Candidatus Colwellbacteria bacterium RIFCSPLOWO2_02_FULL_45_11]OGY62110.1 MAG: threonine--tRNA ligase [Candidatus Colwellbacteria bacterium RIFCSPLOWO2_
MPKDSSDRNIDNVRHSLAHLLAAAVLKRFPKAKLGIGPTIENGFYYDFEVPRGFAPEDIKEFEKTIKQLIKSGLPFKGKKITPAEGRKLFKDQPFKLELIKDFVKEKKQLTAYSTGDVFVDLCKGGHAKNTKEINPDAFKLVSTAGAYWKGDEKNPQLQRIYGVAFNTKKEFDHYLWQQEEARKRDHRKLGQELDLFTFSDLVGPGLALFTPKGTTLRDLLDDFVWSLRKKYGYQKVDIPHITKKELYETSGHWSKFKNELFRIGTREGHEFALKPMNCPHHIQIFARKRWSFRDLPQRYASTTKIYRDEQAGELLGLVRVRSITQDDAHVFCNMDQVETEVKNIWEIISEFYGAFGLPLKLRLSLRDPKQPDKYLGDAQVWKGAEASLRIVADRKVGKNKYHIALGEAAFYGPKLDFMAIDSLGREWQVATIQLDLNMPKRFNLTFTKDDGKQGQIFIIHAAIMGSIERFLAVLIEHYAGAFPVWLSPVQVQVIAVGNRFQSYAEKVADGLKAAGVRVELTEANETLGKRIREGETQKIPYLLIVGEKEKKTATVAVRKRGKGNIGVTKLSSFVKSLQTEITKRK